MSSECSLLPLDNKSDAQYQTRNPKNSVYFHVVQDHYEQLEGTWEDRYQQKLGYFRPFVMDVIYKYLECGDLHFGFARVKCNECNHEYLLPFSCKSRHFCPSCHQKRVVEFGEWLYEDVLKKVPHRQWVFSIPKRLRIYFMYDRKLLAKLSKCAWKVLSSYLKQGVIYDDANSGAVIAVQTFGDFLNFNPHLHIIATDGCWGHSLLSKGVSPYLKRNGSFITAPIPEPKELEHAFRMEVFNLLKKEGLITDMVIENMLSWHNSGFNVHCGNVISPYDHNGLERLAQYIIRAPISQERITYIPAKEAADGVARVIYQAKDGSSSKTFLAIDWLAHLVTHIPNKGEQMVRYYGYYSNKSRGLRKKAGTDEEVPALIDTDVSRKVFRKNWARLIQKVYNSNPLICPKCSGNMKIISFIEEYSLIKDILQHLKLWETRNHDPPENKIIRGYIPDNNEIPDIYNLDHQQSLDESQIFYDDDYCDPPFEDDYSQVCEYEDF